MPATPLAIRSLAAALVAAVLVSACGGSAAAPDATTSPSPSITPSTPTTPDLGPTPSPTPSPSPSAQASPPDHTTVYGHPEELAATLVAAERAIRDPATDDGAVRAWAWVQQAAYRQLAGEPDWREAVLASTPDDLVRVLRRNLRATIELRRLTSPRDELPDDWRIVSPPPADELLGHYERAADEFGIDWTYLAAIHLVESRMGRIRGESVAGARGPMQFLPATWDAYGEGDIEDYGDAIRAAARYLAEHGAPGDMDGAIWAYNHSDHYVQAIQDHAAVMRRDVRAYHAYYHWQVYYRLATGDVILPEGWESP